MLKSLVRRLAYPLLNQGTTLVHRPRYQWPVKPDLVLYGQRGNDYQRHRQRVDKLVGGLAGKRILVFGCGTGKDVPSWLAHKPAQLVGIDLFSYPTEWQALRDAHPDLQVEFYTQAEVNERLVEGSFDVLASDAVLEHLQDAEGYLRDVLRFLKPGGLLYSTFGPLWYGHGGDHLSGYDDLANGYNHLTLPPQDYQAYVDAYRPAADLARPEDDPRLWIRHDLFSRLDIAGYHRILYRQLGLSPVFLGMILEPKALAFRKAYPERFAELARVTGKGKEDLDLAGVTFIGRK